LEHQFTLLLGRELVCMVDLEALMNMHTSALFLYSEKMRRNFIFSKCIFIILLNFSGEICPREIYKQNLEWVEFFEKTNLHKNLQRRNFLYVILLYSSFQYFPWLIETNFNALQEKGGVSQLHSILETLASSLFLLVFLSIFHK
jgi:hypothetical protein